ncbi:MULTISPECIES: amidase [unclassified Herbaspirillum]|uniref:amidase n=1 Tax=unclassified Herbaspirillum TaxID=2624150 RepID=UPI00116F9A91|nr:MULTISPECIES: amidase [unclassified Herbaspirillum]MBB5391562.1 amidase [Herbaspirillum sp. SJZ102]TQK12755.1 amidase [Herbaspirillum sp. SJZ130]TQK14759.1 amidase [Herbaspirillum sp. SJZ106]
MNHPRFAPVPDGIGAFVPHGRFRIAGAAAGPLAGLAFGAKDLFDVAGHVTGAGNPDWLRTHAPATATSPLVTALLNAGATLVGKTLTDEIAYSIHGDNHHYGTPINPAAPGRVPGGSSSGSAAAVAARLCDFALGTDTGGSTRVPASYCGIWGLRTTHGLLSCEAMAPLSPSFDTATWLAHEAGAFARVGEVLLPQTAGRDLRRVLLPLDALEQADPVFQPAVQRVYQALCARMQGRHCRLSGDGPDALERWRRAYVVASAHEAWQTHRDWIERETPRFGPAVQGRWDIARAIDIQAERQARERQQVVRRQVHALLGDDAVAVIPSAASVAPPLDAAPGEVDLVRARTFRITCIAGLCGLPQVSIPLATPAGLPIGVSLLGPAGSDLSLIRLAAEVWRMLQQGAPH